MFQHSHDERRREDLVSGLLIAVTCVASLAAFGFARRAGWAYPVFPLLLVPVILAGWRRGLIAALPTAAIAGLAATYFFLLPAGTLRLRQPDALLGLGAFAVCSVLAAIAFEWLHRRRRRERRARMEAERQSRRAEHLEQIATALSKARTSGEVAATSVLETAYTLGAAAGALVMLGAEEQPVDVAHSVGFPASLRVADLPLDEGSPFIEAVGSRTPVLLARGSRISQQPDRMDSPLLASYHAAAFVPIALRGRLGAVLVLCLTKPRTWTPEEREFFQQVSVRASHALDRSVAYELAERARAEAETLRARADQELTERQKIEAALRESEARYRALAARTSRLHALTAALSEALTVNAVAEAVVRQGKPVVGAQAGAVALLTDHGQQFVTLIDDSTPEHEHKGQRFRAGPGLCLTEAVEKRRPVLVGSFGELQKRYPRSASHAADGGFDSMVALPLVSEGAPIGALSFHFTAPLNFDDDYKALLMSVAQHCAQALDRARLYEAEHGARAVAEAANRLKDDFLSTVSHELRTPLNAILGWASMLRTGSLDAARTARALQAIHDNATRQTQLVDELLDVSRIAAGRASLDQQRLDLVQTIRGAIESVLPLAAAKGIDVQPSIHGPVYILGDARRLEQVFLNLLSNAVKFTPEGGRIEVEVSAREGVAEARVRDSGMGIEAEFIPHVFERFRQADSKTTRSHGGLGLGLSIAKHLVEAHGGSIAVESAGRDKGTTFTVTLPTAAAAEGPERHADRQAAAQPLPDLTGIRVLVVDDEPDAREMMACALADCGTTVITAGSAREALDALERTDVNVLLADIGMPLEDGYSLIRQVRSLPTARLASIPAAAVTAYAREDQRQRALAAGFQLHIPKPVNAPDLARAVAQLVAAHSSQ
jgi:signal transduction histidine kinase/ActR/RegA family two-component response regulator